MAKLKQISLHKQTQLVGSGVNDVISHQGPTGHSLSLRPDWSVLVTHVAAKTFNVVPKSAIRAYTFEGEPSSLDDGETPGVAKDPAKSEAAKKAWETRKAAGAAG